MRLPEAFDLEFAQSEVDFVIPNLAVDLPLCIDPFLLFKSKDAALRDLHSKLLAIFNLGVHLFQDNRRTDLDRLISFPEVNEIGFGYSEGRIRGSGLGTHMNRLLADTLAASIGLQNRGLRHVEELQLVSIGVSHDRISDIAANVLKSFLIDYTQRQARLWGIPLVKGMPIPHYFDFDNNSWADGYFDLPENPISGLPVLLVPRRIVRLLPWINYDDFSRTDFRYFLQARQSPQPPSYPGSSRRKSSATPKKEVVRVTREQLVLLDRYIERKERAASNAGPSLGIDHASAEQDRRLGNEFIEHLRQLPTGTAAAGDYQRLVFEILNYLFEPELVDGQLEVETHLRTERRDIIYLNEADRSFWEYVRSTYRSLYVMFEVKNTGKLEIDHVNQTAAYLGSRLGMLGFIVTRRAPGDNIVRKTYSIYNDTPNEPRKMILILSDEDLAAMIRGQQNGLAPHQYIQNLYRTFRQSIQ